MGRFTAETRVTDLAGIQSALHRRGIEHRMVLVGDGPLRPVLQGALADAVFIDPLSPEEAAVTLASADLFVLPGETDVAADGLLEAQASGLAAVVSAGGGAEEYVRDTVTGVISAPRDAESFGHAAAHLLRNGARLQAMGRAARTQALDHGWTDALRSVYQTYLHIAGCSRWSMEPRADPVHGNATA
jgi:glycosyltransferase involved in cell wall biosynthesis